MILPVVKLGTLVLKTVCKPIASRLKKEAGLHPKFRRVIVNFAQVVKIFFFLYVSPIRNLLLRILDLASCPTRVAGVALIFEVQRSARSEARKEEIRRQEIEVINAALQRYYLSKIAFCFLTEACFLFLKSMKQKEEDLMRDLEQLKQKLNEIEHLAKGRGLSGIIGLRHDHAPESSKSANPAD
ncbi:hypothetical protein BHM03_00047639 [Ensete ventricosum]|nr:hypothetical protein BHM03_00047639 [Ensete ventricosum]